MARRVSGRVGRHIGFEGDEELLHMRLRWNRGIVVVQIGAPPRHMNYGRTELVGEVIGHERASIIYWWICCIADAIRGAELIMAEINLASNGRVDHWLLAELRHFAR